MNTFLVFSQIAPALLMVLTCFIGIGASIGITPYYVNTLLGFSSFTVGIAVAAQYLAMLMARPAAGKTSDLSGPKVATTVGVTFFLMSGVGHLASSYLTGSAEKLATLLLARALLGISESYIVTGALAWAIRRSGPSNAGIVMSWNGNSMYGGVAIGAPLAAALTTSHTMLPVAFLLLALALVGLFFNFFLSSYEPVGGERIPFSKTIRLVAQPGAGLLFSSIGYGTILGFSSLHFQNNGWQSGSYAITCFGAAYVVARIFFGWLPDAYGGLKIAFWSLAVEAIGQFLIFTSANESSAFLGAVLSGVGFSLLVPSLGVEAIRRTPQQARGSAMAGYLAFFDLAFGLAIPLAGVVADTFGLVYVYLYGFTSAICGLAMVVMMKQKEKTVVSTV